MKLHHGLVALLALALLSACGSSGDDLPPDAGALRTMHAITDLETLTFTYDGTVLGDFTYEQLRGLNRPGDGRHDVLIDIKPLDANDPAERLETLDVRTALDLEQTFVLTGTLAQTNVIAWEQPARNWLTEVTESSDDITVLEVSFGHAALSRGTLDFYLGEEDFDPADSVPMATLALEGLETGAEIEAGAYELAVTPAGDPATILLRSSSLVVPAATSIMFVAYDGSTLDDAGVPRVRVRSLGIGFSGLVPDQNAPVSVRAVHALRGTGALDVREGEDEEILIPGVTFGTASPYVESADTSLTISITTVAEPDESLETFPVAPGAGSSATMVIAGNEENVVPGVYSDDNRRVVTHAKLRVLNGASGVDAVDLYVVPEGASIADETPRVANLFFSLSSGYFPVEAGEYDLVFTDNGEKTLVGDRLTVSLENSGVYAVVLLDGAEDGTIETLPLDDLADGG